MRRDRPRISGRWIPIALAALLFIGSACGGAQKAEDGEEPAESEIVGAPPSEQEDPFRVAETPEVAERAESTGYIGGDKSRAASQSDEPSGSDRGAVRASEAEPEKKERPPDAESEVRCFSCVRICPIGSEGETSCEGGERDVICGWGVHEEPQTAQKLARAECDGALDMARQMDQWSRIEGTCPPAECRGP